LTLTSVSPLHGSRWKYDRLFGVARDFHADVVINGGDMLPKEGDLFTQDQFILDYLDAHFDRFDRAGIYYLCYPGNDDLMIFDELFESIAKGLPTIEEELHQLIRPDNMARSIYVIHMPPYHLGLDECNNGSGVGSKAVYDFLLKNQPKLSLHGHIHESPKLSGKWRAELGQTICIQPGQLGPFTYVTIDLQTMRIERFSDER